MTARSLSPEHVLVTGAAGFIGSDVVDRLLADGASVTVLDNYDRLYSIRDKRDNLAGACAHRNAVERAVDNRSITAIIHLAAKGGVRPSLADPMATSTRT